MIYFLFLLAGVLFGIVLCALAMYSAANRGKLAFMSLNEKTATVDTFGDAAYILKEGLRMKYNFNEVFNMSPKHRKFD